MQMRAALQYLLVAFLLLAAPAAARAGGNDREWTTKDTILELSYFTAQTADWMQTRRFLKDRTGLETNPILGQRPSQGELLAYNLITMSLHAAVSYALPRPYRTVWQYVSIGAEVWQVGSNVRTAGGLYLTLP
jgi:hypothetical protein